MPNNAELQAEVDRLNAEADELAAERDKLESERDRLRAEVDNLRGQLTTVGSRLEHQPDQRRPFLSEGDRQALEMYGVTNDAFTGRRLTRDEALASRGEDQQKVIIEEPNTDLANQTTVKLRDREGIEGVDYVYPSVAPGRLADNVTPNVAQS